MSGTLRGTLLQYKNIGRSSSFSPDLFVTSSTESPKLIFTDKENGKINIWITDLTGNLLKSLHADANFDAQDCYWSQPRFLDDSQWLILSCSSENERLTFFIDLSSPNENISLQGLDYCAGGYNDVKSNFPDGEAEWVWWCGKEPEEYCFLSRFENKNICVNMKKRKFPSLDLSKIALVEGDMPHSSDGAIPGVRIAIVDRTCLLKHAPCDQPQEFDLPYYQPVRDEKYIGPGLLTGDDIIWKPSGKELVWLNAPIGVWGIGWRGKGQANVGIIDLTENNNQVLWHGLPDVTYLKSWSPDGNWLLFHDEKGLYIGSIKQQNIRRLVTTQDYGATFYGWLTIP